MQIASGLQEQVRSRATKLQCTRTQQVEAVRKPGIEGLHFTPALFRHQAFQPAMVNCTWNDSMVVDAQKVVVHGDIDCELFFITAQAVAIVTVSAAVERLSACIFTYLSMF